MFLIPKDLWENARDNKKNKPCLFSNLPEILRHLTRYQGKKHQNSCKQEI